MIKSIFLVMSILILGGCSPKIAKVNPNFKAKLQANKRLNVSLIRPDTHVLEVGFSENKEDKKANEKASKIFIEAFQQSFAQYFVVKNIIDDECLEVVNKNQKNESKCSPLLTNLRELVPQFDHKYTKAKLSDTYDITVYIYAMEPTRSAGEVTKDLIVGTAMMALTGSTLMNSYHDTLKLVIIDNHTNKILWTDSLVGGSFDIDNKQEMLEQFFKLKNNFKKALFAKE